MSYTKSVDLQRGHAKMNRAAEVKRIIDAFDGVMSTSEICDKADVDHQRLNRGLLREMANYGIVTCEQESAKDREGLWLLHKPSSIESLKADMMGATA